MQWLGCVRCVKNIKNILLLFTWWHYDILESLHLKRSLKMVQMSFKTIWNNYLIYKIILYHGQSYLLLTLINRTNAPMPTTQYWAWQGRWLLHSMLIEVCSPPWVWCFDNTKGLNLTAMRLQQECVQGLGGKNHVILKP